MSVDERRGRRAQEIVDATRALFDARGMRDAQIDDIAKSVGINRAIIYRHFTTKEELFAVTLVEYLRELDSWLATADDADAAPIDRLSALTEAFFAYGTQYPAFVDCAQALLRYRGDELLQQVCGDRLVELGQAMNNCLGHSIRAIEAGNSTGAFEVTDPELAANILYTQGLGVLNLVGFQRSLRELNSGFPVLDDLPLPEVFALAKKSVIAMAIRDDAEEGLGVLTEPGG